MQAKRFFFEKKKQKTFIHCRRHGVRTENSVPSETDKSFFGSFFAKKNALLCFVSNGLIYLGRNEKRSKNFSSVWCGFNFGGASASHRRGVPGLGRDSLARRGGCRC